MLHLLIPIVPAALTDILHVATIEDALYDEAGFRIVVDLVEVHIPEDPAGEEGLIGTGHGAKLGVRLPREQFGNGLPDHKHTAIAHTNQSAFERWNNQTTTVAGISIHKKSHLPEINAMIGQMIHMRKR